MYRNCPEERSIAWTIKTGYPKCIYTQKTHMVCSIEQKEDDEGLRKTDQKKEKTNERGRSIWCI